MKGQLIPFVFIVLLVAGILTGYVFYNIFYGTQYQAQVFQLSIIDAVRNLIESFKNYLHLSLIYSSGQALREHACLGGSVGALPFIVNGPNPVEVEFSKSCLENYTKYYFNVYFDFFNTTLPVQLIGKNFSTCVYGVDAGGVLSGKYDEGDFWVNCSDAKITVSGENINEFEEIDMNDFVTKNRYWYLFRIFYEWAMDDVYSPCICSKIGCACNSKSGEELCSSTCLRAVEECAKIALDDLQRRFDAVDDFVKCEKRRECCAQGIGPPCLFPCGCQGWNNRICIVMKDHLCQKPPPAGQLCPVGPRKSSRASLQGSYAGSNSHLEGYSNGISFASSDWCWCHYEARLAAGYEFKCVDSKYYVPSDKGPVPLIFVTHAYAFWRDPCACCYLCLCPGCGCPGRGCLGL